MPRIPPDPTRIRPEDGKYYLIRVPLEFPEHRFRRQSWAEGFDPSLYHNVVLECVGTPFGSVQPTTGYFAHMLPHFISPKDTSSQKCWGIFPEWIVREEVPPTKSQQHLFDK